MQTSGALENSFCGRIHNNYAQLRAGARSILSFLMSTGTTNPK